MFWKWSLIFPFSGSSKIEKIVKNTNRTKSLGKSSKKTQISLKITVDLRMLRWCNLAFFCSFRFFFDFFCKKLLSMRNVPLKKYKILQFFIFWACIFWYFFSKYGPLFLLSLWRDALGGVIKRLNVLAFFCYFLLYKFW